jgi:hypothetical protein
MPAPVGARRNDIQRSSSTKSSTTGWSLTAYKSSALLSYTNQRNLLRSVARVVLNRERSTVRSRRRGLESDRDEALLPRQELDDRPKAGSAVGEEAEAIREGRRDQSYRRSAFLCAVGQG